MTLFDSVLTILAWTAIFVVGANLGRGVCRLFFRVADGVT
jgi:hypothetical protein